MFNLIIILWITCNSLFEHSHTAVGEKKRPVTSRSEGAVLGHYLLLSQTAYLSHTPPFQTFSAMNELECKCICSSNKQCLAVTYRLSDLKCSLYGTDPCDTRIWQSNADVNFYINIKRLKYRLFEKPQQNRPLKRISSASVCGSMSGFNPEKRWLFAMKISGQSKVNFHGLNFHQAPNHVAPSPWNNTLIEDIWNSILLYQWHSRLYFPKHFGFALIHNGVVREFVYFRLHKTTMENFFNKQHIPVAFCWNLKPSATHLHHTLDHTGHFKRMFSISVNGNTSHTTSCDEHQTFMYISPLDRSDRCAPTDHPLDSIQILFSDQCHPVSYSKLIRADALIGLVSGDTTTDT